MKSIFSDDHPAYPIVITANVIITTFLAVVSAVATMIADPVIQGELALSDTQTVWLTTLYLLGVNLVVPCGNWFANAFGIRRMYTYGVVIFLIGSFFAAIATNFYILAAGRIIEGIGGGLIFPVGLSLLVASVPKEKISLAINIYVAGAFGGGLGLGVFIAGYLSQFASWRDLFFLIDFVGIFAAIACWLSRTKVAEINRKPFDFPGFFTYAFFICSFIVALTMGPIPATAMGWRTPYILLFLVLGTVSLLFCIFIERKHPNPLIPPAPFKDPVFSVSLVAMFVMGMSIFAGLQVSVEYMVKGILYEKFIAGKIALIYGLIIGLFSVISNYITKVLPAQYLTLIGLSLMAASYFYNNELSWLTGYTQVIAILILRGIGVGLALGPTTTLAMSNLPKELKPSAATILTFIRQLGGTYGGAIISIFSIQQRIFHTARWGEQVNDQLPAYQKTLFQLYDKYHDMAKAKAEIVRNIERQAYIQSLNDSLVALGYVIVAVTCILTIVICYRSWKSRKMIA